MSTTPFFLKKKNQQHPNEKATPILDNSKEITTHKSILGILPLPSQILIYFHNIAGR